MTPAQLIAQNLAALPHPDGTPRQLAGFNTQLLPEALTEQVTQTATEIGDAIVHLLTQHGYTITSAATPPTPEEPAQIANVECTYCGDRVLMLNITNPNRLLVSHHFAVAECPQR